jgi:CheY-like chemotaxis protein
VLDLSKVEAGMLELENINFCPAEVVKSSVKLFQPLAENKGLMLTYRISPDVPRSVKGDPARIRQIINNLLSNAVKFTGEGEIELAVVRDRIQSPGCTSSQIDDHVTLHFSVRDSGVGIAGDIKEKIFERFSQADTSTSRRYGGTGLGLTISSKLVQLMNGRIWLESEPGKGSVFDFTVQFRLADEDFPPCRNIIGQSMPAATQARPLRILLVEDTIINQAVGANVLKKRGYDVTVATNGKEALSLLGKERFDIVLMDVEMPEMDGIEATRNIRSVDSPVLDHMVPVIAITAYAKDRKREECLGSGMNDFITKPFRVDQLSEVIDRWVPRKTGSLS